MCLGRFSGLVRDPVVALHKRNAAEYRLPTFVPHGTKLGHSWYQWLINSDFSGWFENSEKGEVFGHCRWMWADTAVALRLRNAADYRLFYFSTTWHQTRVFLISVNKKKWFFWLVWQFWIRRGCLCRLSGWGVDPVVALHLRNAADYRLPTFGPHGTKLGHSWYQWIIKVIFWLVWQF